MFTQVTSSRRISPEWRAASQYKSFRTTGPCALLRSTDLNSCDAVRDVKADEFCRRVLSNRPETLGFSGPTTRTWRRTGPTLKWQSGQISGWSSSAVTTSNLGLWNSRFRQVFRAQAHRIDEILRALVLVIGPTTLGSERYQVHCMNIYTLLFLHPAFATTCPYNPSKFMLKPF